jgi:hypothetical protein
VKKLAQIKFKSEADLATARLVRNYGFEYRTGDSPERVDYISPASLRRPLAQAGISHLHKPSRNGLHAEFLVELRRFKNLASVPNGCHSRP